MRDVGLSANRRCDRGVLRVETVVNGRRLEFFSELTFSRVVHAAYSSTHGEEQAEAEVSRLGLINVSTTIHCTGCLRRRDRRHDRRQCDSREIDAAACDRGSDIWKGNDDAGSL